MTLFLVSLDNNTMEEIKLKDGKNKLFLDLYGNNEWLILVGNSQNESVSSVEILSKNQTKNPPSKLNVWSIGDCQIDIPNNSYLISTNRGRGITTVSSELFGYRQYLTNINPNFKQASAIAILNLDTGVYSGKLSQFKSDTKRIDELLVYNGLETVKIMDSSDSAQKDISIFSFNADRFYADCFLSHSADSDRHQAESSEMKIYHSL